VETGNGKTKVDGKAFHLLGFDVMFDSSGKAWLLEINDNPSLDIYHTTDYMGGGGPKVISKVDLEVKSIALGNAIKLAKMSPSKRAAF
jgi:tubulin polyglutamylase TTLL11